MSSIQPLKAQSHASYRGDNIQGPTNCIPFGGGSDSSDFSGFLYKNIKPFILMPGDDIGFDLGLENDVDIEMEIAMGSYSVSFRTGEISLREPGFTTVVDGDKPQLPKGDNVLGNHELRFYATQPFVFSGGDLVVRFKRRNAYRFDNSCTQVLMSANADDTSDYFRYRFFGDADGLPPFNDLSATNIGVFRLTYTSPSVVASDLEVAVTMNEQKCSFLSGQISPDPNGLVSSLAGYQIESPPSIGGQVGRFNSSSGEFCFEPDTDFVGETSFSYSIILPFSSEKALGNVLLDVQKPSVNDLEEDICTPIVAKNGAISLVCL